MKYNVIIVFLILSGFCSSIAGLNIPSIPSGHHHHKKEERWAVLMAGSNGYGSYRHQADVCHAYQVLKAGGFRDTHIIVFMYDDIAWNKDNPNPGVIINKPNGSDVYHGVPKDYTGIDVNANNFYAVILGQKNILTAGGRKVVKSGLNDYIFIYIASHSYVGGIGMPDGNAVTATEFNRVLMKKFQAGGYKKMVIYVEASNSGSMFEGLLPENISIYAMTSARPSELSWGIYCPKQDLPIDFMNYLTCLADVFSLAWLEDCERHKGYNETLLQQYEVVSNKVSAFPYHKFHVMQYGDKEIAKDLVSMFMTSPPPTSSGAVNQVKRISFFIVVSSVYYMVMEGLL